MAGRHGAAPLIIVLSGSDVIRRMPRSRGVSALRRWCHARIGRALEEVHLPLGLVLDEPITRRAVPLRLDDGAACLVPERLGKRCVPRTNRLGEGFYLAIPADESLSVNLR